jgi:hypothetical protein
VFWHDRQQGAQNGDGEAGDNRGGMGKFFDTRLYRRESKEDERMGRGGEDDGIIVWEEKVRQEAVVMKPIVPLVERAISRDEGSKQIRDREEGGVMGEDEILCFSDEDL